MTADTNTPPLWFPVGEQLRYRISWGVITVGELQVTSRWVTVQGRRLLAITCRARSNHVLSLLYPVNDNVVTIIDPIGFLPVSSQVNMQEGKHIRQESTTYDYVAGKAVWTAINKQKTRTFTIDPTARDLVTLLYYMRKQGFQSSGSNLTVRALVENKAHPVSVAVGGHETVKVPGLGGMDCLRLIPTIDFDVTFHKPSGITVWISTDPRCVCTRIKVSVPVGSITAELRELSEPGAGSQEIEDSNQKSGVSRQ